MLEDDEEVELELRLEDLLRHPTLHQADDSFLVGQHPLLQVFKHKPQQVDDPREQVLVLRVLLLADEGHQLIHELLEPWVRLDLRDLPNFDLPGQLLLDDVHVLLNSLDIADRGQIFDLLHDLLEELDVIIAGKHHEHGPHFLRVEDAIHQHVDVHLAFLP